MTTHHVDNGFTQPGFPRTNVLGIIFFILGAPNLYALLKRSAAAPRMSNMTRYGWMVLLAGAIASAVELSLS